MVLAVQISRVGLATTASHAQRARCCSPAVDRESRFKAKPVIDIAVYRGGDAISGTAFAALTDGLGLGLGAVAAVGAGIAAVWAATGYYLGRSFERLGLSTGKDGKDGDQAAEFA